MQKGKCVLITLLAFSLLVGCSSAPSEPEMPLEPGAQTVSDAEAKALFEEAVDKIIALATEEPASLVVFILGYDTDIIYEEIAIDGRMYFETTAAYQDLRDYYAKTFTGEALDWILSTKFADVDGTLYCSPVGGASGWSIANFEVASLGQNGGEHLYEATFDEFETTATSRFALQETDGGYRLSRIDYIPSLLSEQ